jgi:hypothetical protein
MFELVSETQNRKQLTLMNRNTECKNSIKPEFLIMHPKLTRCFNRDKIFCNP